MIGRVSVKYALRSLRRHPRRTTISMIGVGVGVALGLFATSWVRGAWGMQVRAASESGAGHVRVVPLEWLKTRENSSRLAEPERTLESVKALPGLRMAVPHARVNGLLAMGNRTLGVEVLGVVPDLERASNRIVYKAKLEGRYLQRGDRGKVVIGRTAAKRLDVELDDDLVVRLSGRDKMQSAMLTIVGILETGAEDLDATICHVTLEDLARITGYTTPEGAALPAEITILIEDNAKIDETRDILAGEMAVAAVEGARARDGATDVRQVAIGELAETVGHGSPRALARLLVERGLIEAGRDAVSADMARANTIVTWKEIVPEIAANAEGDKAFMNVLIFIIIVVVSLGIMSAQLTAVLERRREFGVLLALGMRARQVIGLLLMEGIVIGVGGGIAALAIGGPFVWLIVEKGIDFSKLMGTTSFGGILIDPVFYGEGGWWIVPYAFSVSVAATLVASLYPARFATRTDPADALRVV